MKLACVRVRQARHVHEHVVCGLPEPEPSVHRLAQRRGYQEHRRAAVAEVLQEDDVKGDAPARGAPARRDGGWTLGVTGSA